MKDLYLILGLLLITSSGVAQEKYWVFFEDKGDTQQYQPHDILSPRALERRAEQGLLLDSYDFPVWQGYLDQLDLAGIDILHTSRWFNAVSARLNPEEAEKLLNFPFVDRIEAMGSYQVLLSQEKELQPISTCPEIADADLPSRQLSMVGLDRLHEMDYTGRDILVAVFDNGYLNVDQLNGFAHLRENDRIIATRDYVDGDEKLYHSCEHCRHGTYVFSILAARDDSLGLTGSAPDADFILLRTENDASETHQEEDNWVAAAEFADSMGAQVFTTSLGYYKFDPGQGDYFPSDRDGNTSIITRAADLAASRGIIVVNSAGNSAGSGIVMPADGDSVIAVAAVDPCGDYALFSSQGPSFDERVKPDISAMGQSNYFIFPDGSLRRGNGTSFSCPIASGLATCLLQAVPQATNMQVYDALIRSASQFDNPDEFLGFGIPNGPKALELLQETTRDNQFLAFPNPMKETFSVFLPSFFDRESVELQMIDMMGREIQELGITRVGARIEVRLPDGIHPGHYILRLWDANSRKPLWKKLTVQPK